MHSFNHAPNFLTFCCSSGMSLFARHPNRLRWCKGASFWLNRVYGIAVIDLDGDRLCMYTAVLTASAHKGNGRRESIIIARVIVLIFHIIHSLMPFLCCVYAGAGSKTMPVTQRIPLNRELLYSPLPLSQRNRRIFHCGKCLCKYAMSDWNTPVISVELLVFKKKTQVNLE